MSDLDNQGSLPSYVEHDSGRSPRAKDVQPRTGACDGASAEPDEQERADAAAEGSQSQSPFEPSSGERNDHGEEPSP
jgi:hypothetical protein